MFKVWWYTLRKSTSLLTSVPLGEKCVIKKLLSKGTHHRRLLDLGFTNGASVEVVQKSPFGNLYAYEIRGAIIALRSEDTDNIEVIY